MIKNALGNYLDELEDKITSLQSSKPDLEERLAGLQKLVLDAKGKVNDIDEQITTLEDKKHGLMEGHDVVEGTEYVFTRGHVDYSKPTSIELYPLLKGKDAVEKTKLFDRTLIKEKTTASIDKTAIKKRLTSGQYQIAHNHIIDSNGEFVPSFMAKFKKEKINAKARTKEVEQA